METENQQHPPSFFEKLNTWIRNSVTFKIFSIGILILLMLIPTSMIQSTIREREYRQEDAVNEISEKWSNEQIISGPIISIPYKAYFKSADDKDEVKVLKKYAHFLPEDLTVNGEVVSELRKRGIYEAVLYSSDLKMKGNFPPLNFDKFKIKSEDILWDEAYVSLGISDMRGINNKLELTLNQLEKHTFEPGIPNKDVLSSGVSIPLNLSDSTALEKRNFNIDLSIKGSESLKFLPLGVETNINLSSNWQHPSFDGNFLPDNWEYKANNNGFDAHWNVLQLNRNFPQSWLGSEFRPQNDAFGVNLKVGVNNYQKNTRSAKYAVMIISLTFILFFFIEVINRKRIHPIQYLLVGFALSIFYTLLLAISEHSNFSVAYIISSIAVISLILVYVHGMFKHKKITLALFAVLTLIYAFVFIILQLQDYALLMGSVGLFIVLALIMYYTRKIDWYNLKK